ncbi:hypothetical protein L1887_48233 [Cichorium endivia]|nr:hypothetical protein L1887_48233 [Cichorium endivia]
MALAEWIVDLRARLDQLERITRESAELGGSGTAGYEMVEVVLGLLFSPGAYLTATRQSVAHASRVVAREPLAASATQRRKGRARGGQVCPARSQASGRRLGTVRYAAQGRAGRQAGYALRNAPWLYVRHDSQCTNQQPSIAESVGGIEDYCLESDDHRRPNSSSSLSSSGESGCDCVEPGWEKEALIPAVTCCQRCVSEPEGVECDGVLEQCDADTVGAQLVSTLGGDESMVEGERRDEGQQQDGWDRRRRKPTMPGHDAEQWR